MNRNMNIWYTGYLICDPQRTWDPQVENWFPDELFQIVYYIWFSVLEYSTYYHDRWLIKNSGFYCFMTEKYSICACPTFSPSIHQLMETQHFFFCFLATLNSTIVTWEHTYLFGTLILFLLSHTKQRDC